MTGLDLRELGPGEADVLDAVFAGLSPRSRHLRFHAPVSRLTPDVRQRLLAVDGHRHVAVAAFAAGSPVGIVRLIAADGVRAELSIEVVDAWQGRGAGRSLLLAARARATELGLRELAAEVLVENRPAQALLGAVFPGSRSTWCGTALSMVLPVPAPAAVAV